MSIFYNQVGFETYPADIFFENLNNNMLWNGINIEFIASQGHTHASFCILINYNLFTGGYNNQKS